MSTILGTVEGFVRQHVNDEPDWDTIVKVCDACQESSERTHTVINSLLGNLKDAKSTPEVVYNSLTLLDALVKNVSYARSVVATKEVCKVMEKIANFQEKADIAKKIAKSAHKTKQSTTLSLIYSISSSSSGLEKWSPDDKAMRMIQSWGMLHPAEFPLYLKSVEKWKKAGVVFPAADPEDLVPLPKSLTSSASLSATTSPMTSEHSHTLGTTRPRHKSTARNGSGGSGSGSGKTKSKFVVASERLINAANNSSSLLLDMCTNIGEDGFCVDADVIDSCVTQCNEFSPKLGAFIEALLGGSEIVMEIPEEKREEILNSLLYTKDQIDSVVKLAADIKSGNYDTNPLKKSVVLPTPASKSTTTTTTTTTASSSSSSSNKKPHDEQPIDFFDDFLSSNSPPPPPPPSSSSSSSSSSSKQNAGVQLDFFGDQSSGSGVGNMDFFAQQPQQQQQHKPSTGNSYLDQLLGEYSAPAPPPQPQPQSSSSSSSNGNDSFDFFKV